MWPFDTTDEGTSATPPTMPAVGTPAYPTAGNPGATPPVPPTIPKGAWWFHTITQELVNAVVASGQALGKANLFQLSAAIALASGVVGQARGAVIHVPSASAALNYTANELVVGLSVGGLSWKLGFFNETVNLTTTGAGGMDAGAAPDSGFVAIYAIYNPVTGAAALLATNATSAIAPNIYAGGAMPAGYTASALVSVWGTNSSGQFNIGLQIDRFISIQPVTAFVRTTTYALTATFLTAIVPLNAKSVTGVISAVCSAVSAMIFSLCSTAEGVGISTVGAGQVAGAGVFNNYQNSLLVPQTIYAVVTNATGTPTSTMSVSGYTF